jgi:hypothetical protein
VVRIGERRGACSVFVERPEVKIQFGKPKRRWEDHMVIGLQELG